MTTRAVTMRVAADGRGKRQASGEHTAASFQPKPERTVGGYLSTGTQRRHLMPSDSQSMKLSTPTLCHVQQIPRQITKTRQLSTPDTVPLQHNPQRSIFHPRENHYTTRHCTTHTYILSRRCKPPVRSPFMPAPKHDDIHSRR